MVNSILICSVLNQRRGHLPLDGITSRLGTARHDVISAGPRPSDGETYSFIIEDTFPNLLQDIPSGCLEGGFDVDARFRARLDEQQALLLGPQLRFVDRDLALPPRRARHGLPSSVLVRYWWVLQFVRRIFGGGAQVYLVADKNAR